MRMTECKDCKYYKGCDAYYHRLFNSDSDEHVHTYSDCDGFEPMVYTNEEILEAIDVLKSAKQHECRVANDTIDLCVDVLGQLLSWSSNELE